jgi:queuine tRNA-ribosyltransferase
MSTYPNFLFDIQKTSEQSKARTGVIHTPHGKINTPNFVFCATKASLKGVSPAQLRDEHTEVILSNTYHLMLAPGPEVIEKMGGLQNFTGTSHALFARDGL